MGGRRRTRRAGPLHHSVGAGKQSSGNVLGWNILREEVPPRSVGARSSRRRGSVLVSGKRDRAFCVCQQAGGAATSCIVTPIRRHRHTATETNFLLCGSWSLSTGRRRAVRSRVPEGGRAKHMFSFGTHITIIYSRSPAHDVEGRAVARGKPIFCCPAPLEFGHLPIAFLLGLGIITCHSGRSLCHYHSSLSLLWS